MKSSITKTHFHRSSLDTKKSQKIQNSNYPFLDFSFSVDHIYLAGVYIRSLYEAQSKPRNRPRLAIHQKLTLYGIAGLVRRYKVPPFSRLKGTWPREV